MKRVVIFIVVLIIFSVCTFFFPRIVSVCSITKISDYDYYNLYEMNIRYHYDLDKIISKIEKNDSSYIKAVIDNVLPFLPVKITPPKFGCSSFNIKSSETGHYMMGRNYDFKNNTSAMLVRCNPEDGYASIALAALDNIKANKPDSSLMTRLATLASPFACLDGINEKGVSISVLVVHSKPTRQNTGKPNITTPLAIRLVLDRASTTEEAIQLLKKYDMFASAGSDYHFYINDASGDGRIVEFDPVSENRELVVLPTNIVTNFYIMLKDSLVRDDNKSLITSGRDRYDKIDSVFCSQSDSVSEKTGWIALSAASKPYNPNEKTSNTQWSAMYDNFSCSLSVSIRRDWSRKFNFKIE